MRVKYQENKPIPEGFYLARLDGLEETEHQTYGKSIKWTFTIIEAPSHPEAVNTAVTAMSSMKVSPKSKLFSWLQAFGVILGDNDDFEMDSLLGKLVKVSIKNNIKMAIVDGQERSTTYSNVAALAAYIPQAQSQSVVQQAAVPAQAVPIQAVPIQAAPIQAAPIQADQTQVAPAQADQAAPAQATQAAPAQAAPAQATQTAQTATVVPQQKLANAEDFDF